MHFDGVCRYQVLNGIEVTTLPYIPGTRIERYIGSYNFFFIRETSSVKEVGLHKQYINVADNWVFKGTPMRSGHVTRFKRIFSKTLFCGTLICPLSIWQLGFKLECICWTGKNDTNSFSRSSGIKQVLNECQLIKEKL